MTRTTDALVTISLASAAARNAAPVTLPAHGLRRRVALLSAQTLCAIFFLVDIISAVLGIRSLS